MKKLNEMNAKEQKELAELLEAWLGGYTEEVISRVMGQINEIIENPMTMMMLRELKARREKEKAERVDSFRWIIGGIERNDQDCIDRHIDNFHNHCLTNSGSYRDVLHDLYINPKRYAEKSAD